MITAANVKDLREKTGAGMMDCKKALTETNGDFEKAVDWLRIKGLAAAAKKAGRTAAEGLVAAITEGTKGAVVELNSETDFVARTEKFQNLVSKIAKLALNAKDIDALKAASFSSTKTVEEEVAENVATIGENLSLRRMEALTVSDGVVISYVHNSVADNMGKIAVLIALESTADKAKLAALGKQLAMHAAAARPQFMNIEDIEQSVVARERDIFIEESKGSGKPDNIIEKMVEGRIRKFYEETVLFEQIFIMDNKSKISEVVANAAKEFGTAVTLKAFARFELGEGIEREERDFVADVVHA